MMKRGSGNRTRRDSSIEDETQIGSQLSRSRYSATQDDHVPIDSPLAKLIVLMAVGDDAGAAGIEPDRSEPEPTTAEPLTATVVGAKELKLRQTLGYQLS